MPTEPKGGKIVHRDAFDPYVEIRQVSRHEWRIDLYQNEDTLFREDWWVRRSEAAAQRKGRRALERFRRKYGNLKRKQVIR